MTSNRLIGLLAGVVLVCGLCACWLSVRYYFTHKQLQTLQVNMLALNNTRSAAQGLANDAIEYAKRNPAIAPLLLQYRILDRAPAPAPQSPPPARTPTR